MNPWLEKNVDQQTLEVRQRKKLSCVSLPLHNQRVKVGQSSQLWANSGQSWSNDQTKGAKLEIGQNLSC